MALHTKRLELELELQLRAILGESPRSTEFLVSRVTDTLHRFSSPARTATGPETASVASVEAVIYKEILRVTFDLWKVERVQRK